MTTLTVKGTEYGFHNRFYWIVVVGEFDFLFVPVKYVCKISLPIGSYGDARVHIVQTHVAQNAL